MSHSRTTTLKALVGRGNPRSSSVLAGTSVLARPFVVAVVVVVIVLVGAGCGPIL